MLHLKMITKLRSLTLAALLFAGLPLASSSGFVAVSVGIAPPAIPIYEQPLCPAPGYIWTPGYWAYGDVGYYWVPGVWVAPPRLGVLWTPGYWGYRGGRYFFHDGYWGPTVGFYGGINYGFGYWGHGYYGGEWVGNTFRYNTAVTRVNTTIIHNTYVNREVVRNVTGSRAGFNGPGGAKAKPTPQEQAAAKAEHVPPTPEQRSRVEAAKKDPALHAANNHGKPKAEAMRRLDARNGEQSATAAEARSGAGRQRGVEERAGAPAKASAEEGTTRAAKRIARSPAKADRTENTSATYARKSTQPKRTGEATKPADRIAEHAQPATRRAPVSKARQAAPAANGRGPVQAPENAKKKKPAKDRPDDQ